MERSHSATNRKPVPAMPANVISLDRCAAARKASSVSATRRGVGRNGAQGGTVLDLRGFQIFVDSRSQVDFVDPAVVRANPSEELAAMVNQYRAVVAGEDVRHKPASSAERVAGVENQRKLFGRWR